MNIFKGDRNYLSTRLEFRKHLVRDRYTGLYRIRERGRRRSDAELRNDVLSLLADEGKLSVSELSSKLGYQMPPSSLRAVIKNLMAQGRIEYTESSKRAPNQKIRLRI